MTSPRHYASPACTHTHTHTRRPLSGPKSIVILCHYTLKEGFRRGCGLDNELFAGEDGNRRHAVGEVLFEVSIRARSHGIPVMVVDCKKRDMVAVLAVLALLDCSRQHTGGGSVMVAYGKCGYRWPMPVVVSQHLPLLRLPYDRATE